MDTFILYFCGFSVCISGIMTLYSFYRYKTIEKYRKIILVVKEFNFSDEFNSGKLIFSLPQDEVFDHLDILLNGLSLTNLENYTISNNIITLHETYFSEVNSYLLIRGFRLSYLN